MSTYRVPFSVKIMDFYLKSAIIIDFLIVGSIISILAYIRPCLGIPLLDKDMVDSLGSDLIATSVSLAGFVLASLTIIVTFKDSVSSKEKASTGIDLFFKSKHYLPTVKIFYKASLILLVTFLILCVTKVTKGTVPYLIREYIIIGSLILVTTTIFRSLYLLLQIIKLQTPQKKPEQ